MIPKLRAFPGAFGRGLADYYRWPRRPHIGACVEAGAAAVWLSMALAVLSAGRHGWALLPLALLAGSAVNAARLAVQADRMARADLTGPPPALTSPDTASDRSLTCQS